MRQGFSSLGIAGEPANRSAANTAPRVVFAGFAIMAGFREGFALNGASGKNLVFSMPCRLG
jgi:hypothetical protein